MSSHHHDADPDAPTSPDAGPFPLLGPRRLLVIDDNPLIHRDFDKALLMPDDATRPDAPGAAALFGGSEQAAFLTPAAALLRCPRFAVDHAASGLEGVAMVRDAVAAGLPYELAFVDVRMPPGMDGVRTIQHLWKIDERLQTCICTAFSDHGWTDVLRALGASDRLLILKKPFDLIEIRQIAVAMSEKWRLARLLEQQVHDLELLVRRRTAELQRSLVLDRLTNLPNRRVFHDRLEAAIKSRRSDAGHEFGLIFLGVDRFKVVNESVGHDGGDELLRQIGGRLDEAVRATDAVLTLPAVPGGGRRAGDAARGAARGNVASHATARIGGDEFVVLLDHLPDPADAEVVARRLLEVLSQPYDVGGRRVEAGVSVGVTSSAFDYASADDMLRDADAAMHRGKQTGRGRVTVFSRTMQQEARQRVRVEHDLHGAAERGELRVAYQPIVHAADATLAGHEALIRWEHPTEGLLGPAAFIAAAEENDLICELGGWMLEAAAREFGLWRPRPDTTISVNVSRRQLVDPSLVRQVEHALTKSGIRPEQLKLEVTEGGVMRDPAESVRRLGDLKSLGVQIVIDDFGTGYSSLACLHQFPLDCVKLDRSFIRRLGERDDYAAVIAAIVTLTRALDIELVAEGVETEQQWRVLRDLGCDLLQGFYFAKPLVPEAARELTRGPASRPVLDDLGAPSLAGGVLPAAA